MLSGMQAFIAAVVEPLFVEMGLGYVIAGLAVFVVGWQAFMWLIGRRS